MSIVLNSEVTNRESNLILAETSEIKFSTDSISEEKGDTEFYTRLAIRAATAILSPFGWSEELLANGSMRQSSLDSWL